MMKSKTLLFLFLLLSPQWLLAQTHPNVSFNEGVDLLSTVWRLAGAEEYNRCQVEPYAKSLDRWFADHRQHPAVELARRYHENGTGFDAVVDFGVMLKITEQGVEWDDEKENKLDERWTESMQQEFLPALKDFYREARFAQWYAGTDSIRRAAIHAFSPIASQIQMDWFDGFFQTKRFDSQIILSFLVGPCNYGVSCQLKSGELLLCPVIGIAELVEGHIQYDSQVVLPIVIHEFCHPFCNPLVDNVWQDMKPALKDAFEYNRVLLKNQAYTSPKIMMYETLVRASVIGYLQRYGLSDSVEALMQEEEEQGFALIRSTVQALTDYAETKGEQCLNSFLPRLVECVNAFDLKKYARRKKAEKEAEEKMKVHYACNLKNKAKNLPAGELVFQLTFDRPMKPGISLGKNDRAFPTYKEHSWSADRKTLTIVFVTHSSTTYGVQVLGENFVSEDGRQAVTRDFVFSTK